MLDFTSRDNADREIGTPAIQQRSMECAVENVEVLEGHEQPNARAISWDMGERMVLLIDQPVSSLELLYALV